MSFERLRRHGVVKELVVSSKGAKKRVAHKGNPARLGIITHDKLIEGHCMPLSIGRGHREQVQQPESRNSLVSLAFSLGLSTFLPQL